MPTQGTRLQREFCARRGDKEDRKRGSERGVREREGDERGDLRLEVARVDRARVPSREPVVDAVPVEGAQAHEPRDRVADRKVVEADGALLADERTGWELEYCVTASMS